jgi:hypothetical protein
MKVTLEKFGGLAAGMRRPPKIVDDAALAPAEADELARLVQVAASNPTPAGAAGPGQARDAMTFKITVEDQGRTTVLTAKDSSLSTPFVALRDWLEKHAPGR